MVANLNVIDKEKVSQDPTTTDFDWKEWKKAGKLKVNQISAIGPDTSVDSPCKGDTALCGPEEKPEEEEDTRCRSKTYHGSVGDRQRDRNRHLSPGTTWRRRNCKSP